jgi:hypothetical protein
MTGRYLESDPIGLSGGLSAVDPLGLKNKFDLSHAYTARLDPFNHGGQSSFEIHVMNSQGREVGILGPNDWVGSTASTEDRRTC